MVSLDANVEPYSRTNFKKMFCILLYNTAFTFYLLCSNSNRELRPIHVVKKNNFGIREIVSLVQIIWQFLNIISFFSEFRCYYLYLYKDAVHSNEKKKKSVVPLDFCGLETCTEFDKAKNVLVLITSSSTIYLSFDKVQVRDKWKELLVDYYGTGNLYAFF